MPTNQTLSDLFTAWKSGKGIFNYLDADAPWYNSVDPMSLDRLYYGQHSGDKIASKYLRLMLSDGILTLESRAVIAGDLLARYGQNWSRLWNSYIVEYQPLNSYDVTIQRSLSRSDNESEVYESDTDDMSVVERGVSNTITHGKTIEVDYDSYGFNSTDGEPTNHGKSEEGGTTISSNSGADSTSSESREDRARNKVNVGDEQENERKFGNVGTTTPQRLISEERDLWLWQFFERVFKDIDEVLALKIYYSEYG